MKAKFNLQELELLQKLVEKRINGMSIAGERITEIANLYEKITRLHQMKVDKMRTMPSPKSKMYNKSSLKKIGKKYKNNMILQLMNYVFKLLDDSNVSDNIQKEIADALREIVILSENKKNKKKTKYVHNPEVPKAEKKKYVGFLKDLIKKIKANTTGMNYQFTVEHNEITDDDMHVTADVSYIFNMEEVKEK